MINNINNISINTYKVQQLAKVSNSNKTTQVLPTQINDSFKISFKGSNEGTTCFSLESAMKELQSLKKNTFLGKRTKFDKNSLETIKSTLIENPNKWSSIKDIAKNNALSAEGVCTIINNCNEDSLTEIKNLSNSTLSKKSRYNEKELIALTKQNLDFLKRLNIFASTKLDNNSIEPCMSLNKESTDKILKYTKDIEKNDNDVTIILLRNNIYNNKEFDLRGYNNNFEEYTYTLDSSFDLISKKTRTQKSQNKEKGHYLDIYNTEDYVNNTSSEVRYFQTKNPRNNKIKSNILFSEVKTAKDKDGNVIKEKSTTLSDLPGVFNVIETDKNGTQKILCEGKVDDNGNSTINKNLISPDGTKTDYYYTEDKEGNRSLKYQITDKNNNKLLNLKSSLNKIDEKTYDSTKGDKNYRVLLQNDKIAIINKDTHDAKFLHPWNIFSNHELNLFKKVSGQEILTNGIRNNQIQKIKNNLDSSCCVERYGCKIEVGDDPFVFLHELGHSKDFYPSNGKMIKQVCEFGDIKDTYKKERENFLKNSTEIDRDHINYFIKTFTDTNGFQRGGLEEIVAETNAMIETYYKNDDSTLPIRAQYLQQYFPKTVAKVAKALMSICHSEL